MNFLFFYSLDLWVMSCHSRSHTSRAMSFTLFKGRRHCPLFLWLHLIRGPPILSIWKSWKELNEVDKRPIRRKFKDNPYILKSIEEKKIYIIKFKDHNGMHEVTVDKEIFELFDENERYENSRFYEYNKHIIHEQFNGNNIPDDYSLEEEIMNSFSFNELKRHINKLPEIQKRRIKKYYFDDKTLEEIAEEEKCSKVAVKYSLDCALKNISKYFKN